MTRRWVTTLGESSITIPMQPPAAGSSSPPKILQCETGVPDFCHMDDLVPRELHHVHVVGGGATACCRNWATGAGVSSVKHCVGGDVVPRNIRGERLHLIASAGKNR